jgi:hypothetical protein
MSLATKVYEEAAKANQTAQGTDEEADVDSKKDNVQEASYEEK